MSTSCSRRCASRRARRLAELGLQQKDITLHGAALQCRITTEDPSQGFRPDTGRITTYRSPGGAGIRLDGGTTAAGSQISPHFDSMLAKMTCRARDFPAAVARAKRGARGVPHPGRLDEHPVPARRPRGPRVRGGRPQHLVHRRAAPAAHEPPVARPRDEAPELARRRDGEPAVRREAPLGVARQQAARRSTSRRRRPRVTSSGCATLGPAEFARSLRAAVRARRHRDDVPRRPPVPPRHPRAHARPGPGRPARRPDDAPAPLGRGVGRRDLRRRPAIPRRGPVGAPRGAARGDAEHPDPDAPARSQHGRLHAAARRGHGRLRARGRRRPVSTSSASSTRSTTCRRCGPAIDAVLGTGTAVAEVAVCYTGDLLDPERAALHARLLPAARREHRGVGRAHHRDQGHGGTSATRRRCEARGGAARAVRPARPRPHARHRGRPARDASRGECGGRGCRGCRGRASRRNDEPAVALGARRGARAHRPRHGPRPAGGERPRAVLGGRAAPVPPVRVGASGAHGPCLPPRDPGRTALEPASAGDRPRSRGRLRADREHVRVRGPHPRPDPEGDAVVEGRGRSRPRPRRGAGRSRRLRGEPAGLRHPGLGRRVHGGRARRPAGRLARAVPHEGAGRPRDLDRGSPAQRG